MTSPNDRCMICRGTRQEHGPQTKHAFTMDAGDLKPREEPKQTHATPTQLMFMQLLNLLVAKGVITAEEAMRCLPGVKESESGSSSAGRQQSLF